MGGFLGFTVKLVYSLYKFYFLCQLKSNLPFSFQAAMFEPELLCTYMSTHTEGLHACYLVDFS